MVADSRDNGDEGVTTPAAAAALPKGMVLDKDGKPCRSCTSKSAFSAWAAQAKAQTATGKTTAAAVPPSTTTTAAASSAGVSECPPDVEALGRSTWTFLHTMAAAYPEAPSATQQNDLSSFVRLFSRLYPCWVCAEDFQGYLRREEPRVGSRGDFGMWLCGAHNEVNRKLGKPVFDCSRWEERWKTGPKDGSCD